MIEILRPSKEIQEYYRQHNGDDFKITLDQILCHICDVLGCYHISYSAKELLKDLGLLSDSLRINKKGKEILSVYHHRKYFNKGETYVIVVLEEGKL